jgi:hypothetical protein
VSDIIGNLPADNVAYTSPDTDVDAVVVHILWAMRNSGRIALLSETGNLFAKDFLIREVIDAVEHTYFESTSR